MTLKAVIFDYIGTLVNCKGYSMSASEDTLHSALAAQGFETEKKQFLDAYNLAHQKYRRVRYEEHREVTNAVWVSEALRSLGFDVSEEDAHMKAALNVFFQAFIDTLELRAGAKKLLDQTISRCRVGLISNFTYAPVIHKSLRRIGISQYFSVIVVSEENGWRKPSGKIFQDALSRLQVQAEDAIYIGDSPIEDIQGAKEAGLKTMFVPSQFNKLNDLQSIKLQPDYIAKNLLKVNQNLQTLFSA
jgi:HAD superfamily hydrolase (TIGR01549 family)